MSNFDFEIRTTKFAKEVIVFCRSIPFDAVNDRLIRQVVGSSGSIGANYREANDALGYKDFIYRLKISRKEAKETMHWLDLILSANPTRNSDILKLMNECEQIQKILSSMIGDAIKNHNQPQQS